MNLDQYLLGVLELGVTIGAIGFGAVRLRGRLVPGWAGAPARLAEAILGIFILVAIGQLLGAVGWLEPVPIIVGSVLAGIAGMALGRGGNPSTPSTPGGGDSAIAVAIACLILAAWAVPSRFSFEHGMYGGDTLWYHMPFAARFAQEGSIVQLHFTDPVYLNWFYPQTSELLHGMGIVLFRHQEVLSPLLNLGFLGLALLAAWCAGHRHGVGALAVLAVGLVLDANLLVSRQAGQANNDIVGLAFLLAAVAFLLQEEKGARGPPLLAGLAAGLAVATKLSFVVPALALAIGAVLAAGRDRRQTLVWLGGGLVVAGSFWYARNLIAVGNPLPWLSLGPLPSPDRLIEGRPDFSVAHYLTDTEVWGTYFGPALDERLGSLWWGVLGLAAFGALAAVLSARSKVRRMVGAVALIAAAAYILTPLSASGPEGQPVGFRLNLRYLTPALVLGLLILPMVPLLRGARRQVALVVGLAVLFLITDQPFDFLDSDLAPFAIALTAGAVVAPAILVAFRRRGLPGPALALGLAALAAMGIALGYSEQRDYVRGRYASSYPSIYPRQILEAGLGDTFRWASTVRDQRIALAGTTGALFQYGLYGSGSSNRVQFVGEEGPHGAFAPIVDCRSWRRALNETGYDYLVTTPNLNQRNEVEEIPSPEASWVRGERNAEKILTRGRYRVFALTGPLPPAKCPAGAHRFPVDAFFQ